jgi:hypothetical protein
MLIFTKVLGFESWLEDDFMNKMFMVFLSYSGHKDQVGWYIVNALGLYSEGIPSRAQV